MEIKELYHYMINSTEEKNDEAIEVLSEVLSEIKHKFPSYYNKYDKRLDAIYKENGEHLTAEEAMEYTSHMVNKDGTYGPHWTLEQVRQFMTDHSEYSSLDLYCFYVALNMMYSDYYKPSRDVQTYAELAKDFLNDKDAPEHKLKRYMEAMYK